MDPRTHARFLEYRERHRYFGREGAAPLDMEAFARAAEELGRLEAGSERGLRAEDEARLAELRGLLHLD